MSDDNLLRPFSAYELETAPAGPAPTIGDRVSFWTVGSRMGVFGRVTDFALDGRIKVRLAGIGSFLVPAECLEVHPDAPPTWLHPTPTAGPLPPSAEPSAADGGLFFNPSRNSDPSDGALHG
jgi:hypothetical protein